MFTHHKKLPFSTFYSMQFYTNILLVCLTMLRKIKSETKAIHGVKNQVQTFQFHHQLRSLQLVIKNPGYPNRDIALESMTGGRVRGSWGDSSSNSISSGVETRAAKASGAGAVLGAKSLDLGDRSIDCESCNSRYHSTSVCLGLC